MYISQTICTHIHLNLCVLEILEVFCHKPYASKYSKISFVHLQEVKHFSLNSP